MAVPLSRPAVRPPKYKANRVTIPCQIEIPVAIVPEVGEAALPPKMPMPNARNVISIARNTKVPAKIADHEARLLVVTGRFVA